ncbi:ORF1095 [White spot syndrome virus]|uniref:ORF1095 n=1 Tax=White spot syndrome virus TaxID=342409 RepID=A0A2D3I5R1_9VIRU|nr:ORF1095 [White spot syndrome virus]
MILGQGPFPDHSPPLFLPPIQRVKRSTPVNNSPAPFGPHTSVGYTTSSNTESKTKGCFFPSGKRQMVEQEHASTATKKVVRNIGSKFIVLVL